MAHPVHLMYETTVNIAPYNPVCNSYSVRIRCRFFFYYGAQMLLEVCFYSRHESTWGILRRRTAPHFPSQSSVFPGSCKFSIVDKNERQAAARMVTESHEDFLSVCRGDVCGLLVCLYDVESSQLCWLLMFGKRFRNLALLSFPQSLWSFCLASLHSESESYLEISTLLCCKSLINVCGWFMPTPAVYTDVFIYCRTWTTWNWIPFMKNECS